MADNTVTQTNILGYATPQIQRAAEGTIGRAEELVGRNYQSYADWAKAHGLSGDQVAAFDKLQTDAFANAGNLGQDPYSTASAQGIQALAQKAGAYNYNPTQFANQFNAPDAYKPGSFDYQKVTADAQTAPTMDAAQTGYDPDLQTFKMDAPKDVTSNAVQMRDINAAQMGPAERVNAQGVNVGDINAAQMGPSQQVSSQGITAANVDAAQMGPAERVGTQSFTQPGSADQYMSPYMQNVVDIQKREAQRQSGILGTQQQAQAAQAGAFGGGRDAIMRAERERNLGQQMGDIQAQGSQAAFQNAQQQFNAEQQARLAAQQSNQQAGLTTGMQNLNAQQQANVQNAANQMQAQGMNSQQALQAALANQQAGLTTGIQNLNAQQQTNVQNEANKLQASGMNAQQAMQAALANQQASLTTGIQNLNADQQSRVQNEANRLQASGMTSQQALQAALANQQTGLSVGQQNLASQIGTQQLGTQTGTQTALANLSNQQQSAVQNQAAKLQMQGMSAQQALQAALANQQAGMTTQQQQEQANQYGYGQGMNAAGMNAQYGLAAQQEAERSKQFGSNLGLQGLQAGMQGYGALGSQGQNLYGQTTGNLQLQNAFGTQKQQQTQNMLDASQRNYADEQNYPYKQVGFMSDVVNRQPIGNLGSTMTQPAPSLVSQIAGLGGAAVTGAKLFGKAKGGQIKQRGAGLADLAMYQMSRG